VVAAPDADPGQPAFLGFADGKLHRPGDNHLPQPVVSIYDGTNGGFPFYLDIRLQIIPALFQATAVTGKSKNPVTMHSPQIGCYHPGRANARVIWLYSISTKD
jgi:hypothetical protein